MKDLLLISIVIAVALCVPVLFRIALVAGVVFVVLGGLWVFAISGGIPIVLSIVLPVLENVAWLIAVYFCIVALAFVAIYAHKLWVRRIPLSWPDRRLISYSVIPTVPSAEPAKWQMVTGTVLGAIATAYSTVISIFLLGGVTFAIVMTALKLCGAI